MHEFTLPVVLLCFLYLVNVNSLKLGAENVLSRNVTRWSLVTRDVSVDTYKLDWCGSERNMQCRLKGGTETKQKRVAVETVVTELYCKPGFYASGPSCENDCERVLEALGPCTQPSCCQNKGKCHVVNGTNMFCNCTAGWNGKYCSEPCPTNFYGQGCQLKCPVCSNGGTCDPITGGCDCSPGWKGTTCDDKCNSTTYGKDCALQCDSSCYGKCHHVTGECHCMVGSGGPDCSFTCDDGDNVQCGWFPNCCRNGATCDVTEEHSQCSCPPGYKGKYCEVQCRNWGQGCFRTCLCANGGTCHPVTGECNCSPAWVGEYCKKPVNSTVETPVCPVNCSLGCNQDGRCICPADKTWHEDTFSCKRVLESVQIIRTDPPTEVNLHGQTDYQRKNIQSQYSRMKTTGTHSSITGLKTTGTHSQRTRLTTGAQSHHAGLKAIDKQSMETGLKTTGIVTQTPRVRASRRGNDGSRLSAVSISLITVCAVLSVFVVIALVCSLKNKSNELAPWMVENDARKKRLSRKPSETLPLPPSPNTRDNQYSRSHLSVAYEDKIPSGTHQQVNEEATYSTVNESLIKSKYRPLPSVTEKAREPESPSGDAILPFEKISLSRESSVSSSHQGLQRQYSNISTYEDSIKPLLRSTSVVSKTESFYEDMTRSSRSASLCRPSEISNIN